MESTEQSRIDYKVLDAKLDGLCESVDEIKQTIDKMHANLDGEDGKLGIHAKVRILWLIIPWLFVAVILSGAANPIISRALPVIFGR